MRRLSPKVLRWAFYGAVVAGGMFVCGTLALRSMDVATQATGLGTATLAGLCCLVPIVLGGIALANESK